MLLKVLSLASFVIFTSGFKTAFDENPCPKGSVQGVGNPNECYKLISDAKDWYTADGICQDMKGHLISVHDAYSNTYFVGMAGGGGYTDFWIGGNNNNLNGTWKWIDGSAFDYDDWAPGNPQPSTAYCISSHVPSGFWYSMDCRGQNPFICSIPPAHSLQPSCLPGWNYFDETKSCYKVVEGSVNNNMTCDLGNELCFKLNSTLTSIHSDAENFFVLGLSLSKNRNANMYTAIGIISDGYTFKWRDGTPVDYSYWNSNVLRADTCAVMFTSLDYSYISQWVGGWNHNQMSASFNKAVCKMSAYGNA